MKTLTGELITVWEGRGESDSNEGRGGTYTVGYYLSKEEAVEGTKDKGVWGTPSNIIKQHQALRVASDNGSYEYYEIKDIEVISIELKVSQEKQRELALAKLSSHEKKLLGLE